MTAKILVSGYPRVGSKREYKWNVEKYWRSEITLDELNKSIDQLIQKNWETQKINGVDYFLVGDFSFYDQVLDTTTHLGIPQKRFGYTNHTDLENYFNASRGGEVNGNEESPLDMTKWFDTNYHYLVPEIDWDKNFQPTSERFEYELKLSAESQINVLPKIIGPATLLTLSKETKLNDEKIEKLVNAYKELFIKFEKLGFKEVFLDEGALGVGKHALVEGAYSAFEQLTKVSNLDIHLFGYFGKYEGLLEDLISLNINRIHLDNCYEEFSIDEINKISKEVKLSLGVVNGRTIWKSNLLSIAEKIKKLDIDDYLISTSCSLLHVPYSLDLEDELDSNLKNILSFAEEKLFELNLIKNYLNDLNTDELELFDSVRDKADEDLKGRKVDFVRSRVRELSPDDFRRKVKREERLKMQSSDLKIPNLPTTTIGSFPQTGETRSLRRQYKSGEITEDQYKDGIKLIIKETVDIQEQLDIDVLVHGEAERNDMVEYFGELLEGFAFSKFGWVQSYGSRCVKPPIIFGDVYRNTPMTVEWSAFAQSLTTKLMKGMLTGPVTILQWSFYRDDISKKDVAYQIGLALRDEVNDLESNGIRIIQIDEPAIREGLPLNPRLKEDYLDWAVNSFKLSASGVSSNTQIHSHMCYSEFDEILDAINALDVDVLSIEASRSGMDLVDPSLKEKYEGAIGPGVYDIHSPLVLQYEDAVTRIQDLVKNLRLNNIWINPDCGLKTRNWEEVKVSLDNMVKATKKVKESL
jgi:5-methyltetrahydropteroyltriglutamate--homocysteine methyltransferase